MKKLSIVGKDYHTEEHVVGYYTTGDRMLYWGKLGAFWGGFWGPALRLRLFLGAGHRSAAGGGTVGHVDRRRARRGRRVRWVYALGAALYSIGIPQKSVLQYETEVKSGKLLLVANGTPAEVERAKEILHQAQANVVAVHASHATVGV